jgi:hypothetical protein
MDFEIDCKAFERRAKELHGTIDQVPFALAKAMNAAAKNTRQVLVQDTWPQHVLQRNSSFIGRALRTDFATKRNLRVEIYDSLGRAHLKLHDAGGTKEAKGRLAIPPLGAVSRGSSGVRRSQRPRAIIANTPKRALRITPKGIFVGKGGHLRLMYAFKPSASQPADVPFSATFRETMAIALRAAFPAFVKAAMATRR